jgi:MFS family permease
VSGTAPAAGDVTEPRLPDAAAWRARLAISAIFLANGTAFATWASRIPAVRTSLGLDDAQLGLVLFALAAGALTSFPLAGALCTRLGPRRVVLAVAALSCLVLPAPALADSAPWLALSLFLFGAVNGSMDVAMNAYGARVEQRLGRSIMSSLHGMWSVGGLLGASVGAALASAGVAPVAHFAAVAAGLGVLLLVGARHQLRDAVPTQTGSTQPAAVSVQSPAGFAHAAAGSAQLPPGSVQSSFGGVRLAAGSPQPQPLFAWRNRALLGQGVVLLCAFLVEGAILDWTAVYLRDTLHATESVAALGFAAFSITMLVMRFRADAIVERIGPSRLVTGGGAAAATGLLLAIGFANVPVALAGYAIAGLGLAAVAPLVFSAAAATPGVPSGIAVAAVAAMGYGGMLAGPPLLGLLAQATSLRAALALLVLLSLVIAAGGRTVRRS